MSAIPLPPELERVQRAHELSKALEAARALQARLELLGDRATDVAVVVSLRSSLARDLAANGTVVVGLDAPPGYKPNHHGPAIVARAGLSDD